MLHLLPELLKGFVLIENTQAAEGRLHELVDNFNSDLRDLLDTIANQPANLKATLNNRLADAAKDGIFDIIGWIDCIEACLPEPSRRKLAALRPKISSKQALPIANLWEVIPSITRSRVEREVERELLKRSGVEMLRSLPDLLRKFRPPSRQGAPLSLHLMFVSEIDSIWLRMGLKGRRHYDSYAERHPQSAFQKFCNAALAAVGDDSQIPTVKYRILKSGPNPIRAN